MHPRSIHRSRSAPLSTFTRISSAALLALCAIGAPVSAQGSLSTTFVSNNGLSNSNSGNMFDVKVTNPAGIEITKIDVNIAGGPNFPVGVDIYITANTWVGANTKPQLWTLISRGASATNTSPRDTPTPVDVDDFFLAPGTYGLYIVHTSATSQAVGPKYTNGTGTGPGGNQVHSNADLTLTLGSVHSTLWGGSFFNPRVWNGTIYYDANDTAATGGFGVGCNGSNNLVPSLTSNEPKLGGNLKVDLANLLAVPVSNVTLLFAFKQQNLDLGLIGMPGCFLLVNPVVTGGMVNLGGKASMTQSVPNVPALAGAWLLMQAAPVDAAANPFGLSASNGLAIRLGK